MENNRMYFDLKQLSATYIKLGRSQKKMWYAFNSKKEVKNDIIEDFDNNKKEAISESINLIEKYGIPEEIEQISKHSKSYGSENGEKENLYMLNAIKSLIIKTVENFEENAF